MLDGEICCLEPDGRTDFNKLLFRREWPHPYAFDVLSIDAEDMTSLPLLERKRRLLRIMPFIESRLLYLDSRSVATICSDWHVNETSRGSSASGRTARTAPAGARLAG